MVEVRRPDYVFEEDKTVEIDWDSLTDQEIDDAVAMLNEERNYPEERYKMVVPDYANAFLEDCERAKADEYGFSLSDIFEYLEWSFEVNMDHLELLDAHSGIVKFSTGNYPFGGLEKFLITLRAFDLTPTEYFDGFTVDSIRWVSPIAYTTTELPDKTKSYLG